MGVLGETSEPLLSSAINQITEGKKDTKVIMPIENIIDNIRESICRQ